MSRYSPILLNGKTYSKTKALKKLKEILNKYAIGDKLRKADFLTVKDVLNYHPEGNVKIGCGIKRIEIVSEEVYGHRRFEIVRKDDSRIDFSYIKSLQHDNLHFKDVVKAARFAVIDQTRGFKNKVFGNKQYVRCPITNLNMQKKDAHTDHKPPLTFDTLLFHFLKERKMQISDISIEDTEYISCLNFSDKSILCDWQEYHRQNAELQIVLDHANLGQSKTKVPWEELRF